MEYIRLLNAIFDQECTFSREYDEFLSIIEKQHIKRDTHAASETSVEKGKEGERKRVYTFRGKK